MYNPRFIAYKYMSIPSRPYDFDDLCHGFCPMESTQHRGPPAPRCTPQAELVSEPAFVVVLWRTEKLKHRKFFIFGGGPKMGGTTVPQNHAFFVLSMGKPTMVWSSHILGNLRCCQRIFEIH